MTDNSDSVRIGFNRVLADRYFAAASQYAGSWDTYLKLKEIIVGAEVDITAFYDEHGSLISLKVRCICPKTKSILETILKEGEEARGIVAREKEKDLDHKPKDRHLHDPVEEMPRLRKEE